MVGPATVPILFSPKTLVPLTVRPAHSLMTSQDPSFYRVQLGRRSVVGAAELRSTGTPALRWRAVQGYWAEFLTRTDRGAGAPGSKGTPDEDSPRPHRNRVE